MTPPLTRAAIAAASPVGDAIGDPRSPAALLDLLRALFALGRRDLPLGRVVEGHVDALQIVARYGTADQVAAARYAVTAGAAFGVWNADLPGDTARLDDGRLSGGKSFASGAGLLSHALVPVDGAGGRQLLLVDLAAVPPAIDRSWWCVTGMQRSETHIVRWHAQPLAPEAAIGTPGDYVRQPWFGGGALRFAAVQAGGVAGIVDRVRDHLVATGRSDDPHQSGRLAALHGHAQAAVGAVARAAAAWDADEIERTLAHVAAARVAVYEAGEAAIALAQAAVGVSAMFVDHPLAAPLADLAVYLRQPGPDAQRMAVGRAVASGLLETML